MGCACSTDIETERTETLIRLAQAAEAAPPNTDTIPMSQLETAEVTHISSNLHRIDRRAFGRLEPAPETPRQMLCDRAFRLHTEVRRTRNWSLAATTSQDLTPASLPALTPEDDAAPQQLSSDFRSPHGSEYYWRLRTMTQPSSTRHSMFRSSSCEGGGGGLGMSDDAMYAAMINGAGNGAPNSHEGGLLTAIGPAHSDRPFPELNAETDGPVSSRDGLQAQEQLLRHRIAVQLQEQQASHRSREGSNSLLFRPPSSATINFDPTCPESLPSTADLLLGGSGSGRPPTGLRVVVDAASPLDDARSNPLAVPR